NGTDTRDFFQGSFANTINGTTTQNAFSVSGVQDAGGTGNVNTGATGTYNIDEQVFNLSAAFATQTLTTIKITGLGGGTPILLGLTAVAACYAAGTRILTETGEVPIEALQEGDRLVTRDGLLPVRWIGRRRVDCRRQKQLMPIRVRAGAFGDAPV